MSRPARDRSNEEQPNLNRAIVSRERYTKIVVDVTGILERDPKCAGAYFLRAKAYRALGKLDPAIEDYKRAIELAPECAEYRLYLAGPYHARGDYDTAIASLTHAIRLDPRCSLAYRYRGAAHYAKGRMPQAISDLTESIRLDPACAGAYCDRCAMYLAIGKFELALTDASEAIRLDPDNALAYACRSAAFGGKQQFAQTVVDATRAIGLNPRCAQAYSNRARANEILGNLDTAIQDLHYAIQLEPQAAKNYFALARIYCAIGDSCRALTNVDVALRLSEPSAEHFVLRGTIRASAGQTDLAIRDFGAALHLDAGNERAYLKRGDCYRRQNSFDKALDDYNAAIRISARSPFGYEKRGALWIEHGEYARGIADIETAVELDPRDLNSVFDVCSEKVIDPTLLEHGEQQVRRLLQDRPPMARYLQAGDPFYEWAVRMFAHDESGIRIFWDPSEPAPHSSAMYLLGTDRKSAMIQVRSKHLVGPDKGKNRSFEELWRDLVFELYNATSAEDFQHFMAQAASGELSKDQFVRCIIDHESLAAEGTRAVYINLVLPWAENRRVDTHPSAWFVAWKSCPSDSLLRGRFLETPYWHHYECTYDLIHMRRLITMGRYQEGIALASTMRQYALNTEQEIALCKYTGFCLLRLNRPIDAVDAYSTVIRLDPADSDAYQGRALAHAASHDMKSAIADSSDIIRLHPNQADAYRFRASLFEQMGDLEGAQSDLATARLLSETGSRLR